MLKSITRIVKNSEMLCELANDYQFCFPKMKTKYRSQIQVPGTETQAESGLYKLY